MITPFVLSLVAPAIAGTPIQRVTINSPSDTSLKCALTDVGTPNYADFTVPPGRTVVDVYFPSNGTVTATCAGSKVSVVARPTETPAKARQRFSVATIRALQTQQRAFGLDDVSGELLQDTLQILAEVTKKRFTAGMVGVVQHQVEQVLCKDLSWQSLHDAAPSASNYRSVIEAVWPAARTQSVVPSTCTLVSKSVLLDLVNDPTPLLRSVETDGVDLGFTLVDGLVGQAVTDTVLADDTRYILRTVQRAAHDLVESGGQLDGSIVEAVAVDLAHGPWEVEAAAPAANGVLCALDLGVAAATVKAELVNEVDAASLLGTVASGGAPFSLEANSTCHVVAAKAVDLSQLAASARDLARQLESFSRLADDADRRVAAVQLAFSVIHLVAEEAVPPPSTTQPDLVEAIDHVGTLLVGILQSDLRTTLAETVAVIETLLPTTDSMPEAKKFHHAIDRVTPVIAALASNAQLLAEGKDHPERADELKAARTQTIESLIDASTRRDARESQWIVSLGANPGISWKFGTALDANVPLSMPMGVGIDRVPGREGKAGFGFHGQLSILDLARYLPENAADTEFTWQEVFQAEAQAGLSIGSATANVNLNAGVRWSPYETWTDDDKVTHQGALSGMVSLSYYVPFFDFN